MIKIKNPNQLNIFDPWAWLTPKRRQMLEDGWPGLFRNQILPTLPVHDVAKFFDASSGRPTKELHAMLGALVLQQTFDLTDEQAVEQFAFNIQWHFALNITEESDCAKYFSPKTLWNNRNIVAQNHLHDEIFNGATQRLAGVFGIDFDRQRLDSVHIKSNMRRLSRIGIFSESIHQFLVNLKRSRPEAFSAVESEIIERYLTPKALSCFSRVEPSESRKTLCQVARDLFGLIRQFKGLSQIEDMYSYKLLARVLKDQCSLTDDQDNPVELKPPKEIASDSLQNPSDPEATYSGHKGQGYHVQIMETFCSDKKSLNLITHVEVEPAHKSDAHALIPAIESASKLNLKPSQVTADSLYGSDENFEQAKAMDAQLIAPTMGTTREGELSLSDFQISEKGRVLVCPQGHAPAKVEKKRRHSVGFAAEHCRDCPNSSSCPVRKGKKYFYLRFTDKQMRLAQRRAYEQSNEFKERYRMRSGVEAAMSEYDRRTGVKHLRVRGIKAVSFCATLKALGLNIFRAVAAKAAQIMPAAHLCEA